MASQSDVATRLTELTFDRADLVRAQVLTKQAPKLTGHQTRWKTCGQGWQFHSGTNGECLSLFSPLPLLTFVFSQASAGSSLASSLSEGYRGGRGSGMT